MDEENKKGNHRRVFFVVMDFFNRACQLVKDSGFCPLVPKTFGLFLLLVRVCGISSPLAWAADPHLLDLAGKVGRNRRVLHMVIGLQEKEPPVFLLRFSPHRVPSDI